MKIAVIGTGAMGSIYAGLLASVGNEVWAVDVWREHIDAINTNGLRIEGASGDRTVKVNATTDTADIGTCDLVIIATKGAYVGEAARSATSLLDEDTPVLTIQNGLGAAERICEHLPGERVLIGVAGGFGASMKGPGHAHHNGMELIRLGEMNGDISPRLDKVAAAWKEAGFNIGTYDDIQQLVWEKFICNVSLSGPTTVLEKTIGETMADENAWGIALSCGLEAYEAGVAKGVQFSFDDATAYITAFAEKMPDARPSMLQDYLAGRRTEIDAINGMVPVVAREVGTAAPTNEVITALVKAKEASFS